MDRVIAERDYWEAEANKKDVAAAVCDKEVTIEKCLEILLPKLKGSETILEIGCGIGRLAIPIAQSIPGVLVRGIDISKKMVHLADDALLHADATLSCYFSVEDGRTIPVAGPKYNGMHDAIYSVAVFQHLDEEGVKAYFNQVGLRLKKGGLFIFQYVPSLDQDHHNGLMSHAYAPAHIYQWLKEAGLGILETRKAIYPEWDWVTAIKE